ncbi:MAG: glycosyltransferase family 4 protein [Coriobacteriia bacterium]|nr:glycosyltransferase family 4 protein [Coriobacteriia bacterium]
MSDGPSIRLSVAVVATSSRPGLVRYARGLVGGLLQLPSQTRPQLTLIVAAGQTSFSERRQKCQVITLSKDPATPAGLREISRIIRRLDPEVVHVLDPAVAGLRTKTPLVATLHDLAPLVLEDSLIPAPQCRGPLRLVARAAKTSQALIVPTQQAADVVARRFPVAADRLCVIPKAADDFVATGKELMPDLMHRLPPTQFFLAMGNAQPYQNLSVVVQAFGHFFQQAAALTGFDVRACPRLLLVGKNRSGQLAPRLPLAASELIHFTNRVTDEELRWLYAHTLAFVAPSHYASFGTCALEAASFATPILAAHAGALPEVLGEGEGAGAVYFKPDDPEELAALLLHIARDQDFVDALSAAAYKRAATFSWHQSAEATLALYERLCSW